MRKALGWLAVLLAVAAAGWFARDHVRRHPQDVPWTRLELEQPIGYFTGRKLAKLTDEPRQCRALLARGGIEHRWMPPRRASPDCGYEDGVLLAPGEGLDANLAPAGLVTSCPVAAALVLLEDRFIQPAALRHLGSRVAAIEHFGSYSCRRLYGRGEGQFSEHATADALDIAGFRLVNGRRISVLRDWDGAGRSGPSCAKFATARATCSRPYCHPITTRRTPTISTWTRRNAGRWAGGCAAERPSRP